MLVLGKAYKLYSGAGELIIPLIEICRGRAIFVCPENAVTPFVSWGYNILKDNNLDCYQGNYYYTLEQALKGEGL